MQSKFHKCYTQINKKLQVKYFIYNLFLGFGGKKLGHVQNQLIQIREPLTDRG